MVERLFSLTPAQWAAGTLSIDGSWLAYVALVAAVGVLVAVLTYRSPARPRDRWRLAGLRTALLALLVFLLFDPTLTTESVQPINGEVAVLLDDTLSMQIADQDGQTRGAWVTAAFAPGSGTLAQQLDARFQTRYWRFAGSTTPLTAGEPLHYSGSRSPLGQALDHLARERSQALAAIVLVTDGGSDDPAALEAALHRLRAAGIRVHTVGVGSERLSPDLALAAVRLPERLVQGDSGVAEVVIRQHGLDGQPVTLTVEEDSTIVATPSVVLPTGREWVTLHVPLTFPTAGARRLAVTVSSATPELLRDNNQQQQLVPVRAQPLNVLHVEGEPRFEVKFLRRAVEDDPTIRLVSLVRTAENKFFRLGIDSPEQLAGGFPATAEELFTFDLLILGSADAQLLATEQQTLIRDFVSRRGGSVLVLGGNGALAEGGYAHSVLAELLPVRLDAPNPHYLAAVPLRLTVAGSAAPLPPFTAEQWAQLPPLTVVNPLRQAKPGARVLLTANDGATEPLILFASQRYGRGTVAVFPVRNSWRWQMHPDLGPTDTTYETLWRTLLRGLARPAPGRLHVQMTPAAAARGQAVTVTAELVDAAYRPQDNAQLTLALTTPLGDVSTLPLVATGGGRYRAEFVAADSGRYDLSASLAPDTADALKAEAFLAVDSAGQEFQHAERDTALLARIAAQTGGRLFSPDNADELLQALDATRATRTEIQRFALWHAPIFLFVLLLLASSEWAYRRRCALA